MRTIRKNRRLSSAFYLLGDIKQGELNADKAFDLIPEDSCPPPVYDDLKTLMQFLLERKDQARAERILNAVTGFAKDNNGTVQ